MAPIVKPKDILPADPPAPVPTAEELQQKITELSSKVQDSEARETGYQDRIAELEKAPVVTPPVSPPSGGMTPAQLEEQWQTRVREGIFSHPAMTLDEHFQYRMGPVLRQHYESQSGLAKEVALAKESDTDRKKYGGEVDKLMSAVDPVTKANPASWTQAFKFVRAEHLEEIVKDRETKIRQELAQPPPAEGPTPSPKDVPPSAGRLTPEEEAVADRYIVDGVFKDRAEYSKWRGGKP